MVTAAWDTSNLVALYTDEKQCTSCCGTTLPDPNEEESICYWCTDIQPIKVQVDFSGFVDPGPEVCVKAAGTEASAFWSTGIATLLNGSHILDYLEPCTYRKEYDIGLTWRYYSGFDWCEPEDEPDNKSATVLFIQAKRVNNEIEITVGVNTPDSHPVFWGNISVAMGPVGNCFVTENTADNTYIGGPCGIEESLAWATGTAGVTV